MRRGPVVIVGPRDAAPGPVVIVGPRVAAPGPVPGNSVVVVVGMLALASLASLASCTGEPATYLDACESDSACAAPLQCLVPTNAASARCSVACDDDATCGELTGSACYPCEGGVCAASDCT